MPLLCLRDNSAMCVSAFGYLKLQKLKIFWFSLTRVHILYQITDFANECYLFLPKFFITRSKPSLNSCIYCFCLSRVTGSLAIVFTRLLIQDGDCTDLYVYDLITKGNTNLCEILPGTEQTEATSYIGYACSLFISAHLS